MKKLTLILVSVILALLVVSCERIRDSNSPSYERFSVYKNGKFQILGSTSPIEENLKKNLRVKIVPEGKESVEYVYKSDGVFLVPLNNKGSLDADVFTYIIIYKDKEVFHEKLRITYKMGNPWPVISTLKILNKNNEWENPKNISFPITDENGNPTEYTFESNLLKIGSK